MNLNVFFQSLILKTHIKKLPHLSQELMRFHVKNVR